jgi:hypothetical protein
MELSEYSIFTKLSDDAVLELLKRSDLNLANIDEYDINGHTLLYKLVYQNRQKCVDYILSIGADVNKTTQNYGIPLATASTSEMFISLFNAGATPVGHVLQWKIQSNQRNISYLLIDRGTPICLDAKPECEPSPDWVTKFVIHRNQTRRTAIIVMCIHKFKRTNVMGRNNRDAIRLVAKHIWSFRMVFNLKKKQK